MHPTGMNRLSHWIVHEAWIVALELALVAAFAVGLAYWTWLAFSPATLAAPSLPGRGEADRAEPLANRDLFGAAPNTASAARRSSVGLTLLGVFSGKRPGEGRAILVAQGSRPATLAVGESFAGGAVLHEVHPDHVIVLRDGVPERVELERRVARQAAPGAGAPAAGAPAAMTPRAGSPARVRP
jgi:type II secretory pathway component PulC